MAEAAALDPAKALLVAAVGQLVRTRYAIVAHLELVALWTDRRKLLRQICSLGALVLHFELVELVLEFLLGILEKANSGWTVDQQSQNREGRMRTTEDGHSTPARPLLDARHELCKAFRFENALGGEDLCLGPDRELSPQALVNELARTSRQDNPFRVEKKFGPLSASIYDRCDLGDPLEGAVLAHLVDPHSFVVAIEDLLAELLVDVVEHGVACVGKEGADQLQRSISSAVPSKTSVQLAVL